METPDDTNTGLDTSSTNVTSGSSSKAPDPSHDQIRSPELQALVERGHPLLRDAPANRAVVEVAPREVASDPLSLQYFKLEVTVSGSSWSM